MHQIKIQQWPDALGAGRGSVLDAALSAGVPYPHSCRSGDCGTCKSRLLAGKVVMDGCAPEALSDAERAAGLILACRARPAGDVEVAWLEAAGDQASHPVRRVQATVVRLDRVTHDITRLRLTTRGAPLAFSAGQFATLRFAGCPARSYSMANRPEDPVLEFHVRHVPDGVTSGHVAQRLRMQDRVDLEGPFGTAFLRQPVDRPVLLVAGGSGLAPIKSMLLAALGADGRCPIHLYHGVREARDLYFAGALERLQRSGAIASYTPVLSAAVHDARRRGGFVHLAIAEDFSTLSGHDVYVAGPPPMVDAVTRTAVELGARREDVRADAFYSSQPADSPRRNPLSAVASLFRRKVA